MADVNSLVSEAVSIVSGAQPSGEALGVLVETGTKMPLTLLELVKLSPVIIVAIAGLTYVVKTFVLDKFSLFVPLPGIIVWLVAFFVVMLSAFVWMPILLPILFDFVGGN